MPFLIGSFCDCGGAIEIGGSVTVTQRDGGETGSQESGILVANTAVAVWSDVDVAGQRIIGFAQELCTDRAEVRPLHRRLLSPAGVHDVGALAVIVFSRVQA